MMCWMSASGGSVCGAKRTRSDCETRRPEGRLNAEETTLSGRNQKRKSHTSECSSASVMEVRSASASAKW